MKKRNFLLGKGERLTKPVQVISGGGPKNHPYSFEEAKKRLEPMLDNLVTQISELPSSACPDDLAIATFTLNPEYLAKSYFPSDLLRDAGLEAVGSRKKKITPNKKSLNREPEETFTTEIFVRGTRQRFTAWKNEFSSLSPINKASNQIIEIEEISFPAPEDKLKNIPKKKKQLVYEVVLHMDEENAEARYLGFFKKYLQTLKINAKFERRFYAGRLCFLEVEASADDAKEIAKFSLVRVIRPMPPLRLLRPSFRLKSSTSAQKIKLPKLGPLDENIKVAIFDGGIPQGHPITRWANPIEIPGLGPTNTELTEHGVAVTSALLFGHINPDIEISRPYSHVDHYRVIDTIPGSNPYELFEVLERIDDVLQNKHYEFINLSLGPRLPIDDDEIHAWTAILDEHLSSGTTLATIAVGNDGEGDASIGANRIQVPADCVNALSIGACDVPDENWKRASYSSIGPGRSPGIIKPDIVDFGGTYARPFLTVDAETGYLLNPTGGTSFSSPATLRLGTGVRAHFGNSLQALAIRALLVHCAEKNDIPVVEVGWGRVARNLDEIVICDDHVIRVVYQGTLSASKYVRVPIPLPSGVLKGMVTIKATVCYATSVDPHHPDNYTRSGLELFFRPNKTKLKEGSTHADTSPFFSKYQKSQTEEDLRRDAWKWENCVHAVRKFQGKTLNEPVFDIHYNARLEGHNDKTVQKNQYAIVISVEAPKVADLYDQVVRRYATQLEPLKPVIDIPLQPTV